MSDFANPLTARIAAFLQGVGIETVACSLPDPCFLPGVEVDHGTLRIDEARLLYPGDLLHEAGHLAVMTAADWAERHGSVGVDMGE